MSSQTSRVRGKPACSAHRHWSSASSGAALLEYPVTWAVTISIFGSFHPGVTMAVGTLSARPENRAVDMGLFYPVYYAGGAVVPTLCGWAADMAG
jgi:hypothetical protein